MLDFRTSNASSWSLMSFLFSPMLHLLLRPRARTRTQKAIEWRHAKSDISKQAAVLESKEKFPNLRAHALKCSSVFGSTYLCKQFFSKMSMTKSRYRSRLTDENFSMQLRVASSSARSNIKRLVNQKSFQKLH